MKATSILLTIGVIAMGISIGVQQVPAVEHSSLTLLYITSLVAGIIGVVCFSLTTSLFRMIRLKLLSIILIIVTLRPMITALAWLFTP